jgi:hypothetical protein
MAKTRVSHLTLSVSTVKVFIETMKFIGELDLWDDAESYLKANGKTELFFDYEVFYHFRKMLEGDSRVDPNDPDYKEILEVLFSHEDPTIFCRDETS